MPAEFDLIVVGGGPAGSTAAAIAARAGLRVLLLEAAEHPRVHVGESLLPGIIPILKEMGALADVEGAGFTVKTGSTHWGWGRLPEWDLWFRDSEVYDHAWLVDRSRFDAILFRAAARAGAIAVENAAVKSFEWSGERVLGVRYRVRGEGEDRQANAPFTVDASGQAALIPRHLGLRALIPGLQHRAAWAHYEHGGRLPPPREGQALFAASDGKWMWHFPLSPTQTSVGVILLDDEDAQPPQRLRAGDKRDDASFDALVKSEARLFAILGEAARRVTPVRHLRDWSYLVSRVCGPGWLLAGDSSGFIDPVLSTGVQLAMHAGFHAAQLVAKVVRGQLVEERALADYQRQHAALFADMLRIVRFFYQQNLHRDDYFWESKKILLDGSERELRPQKAFLILTSGLVRNLALASASASAQAEREAHAQSNAATLDEHDPDRLGFVCIQLRMKRAEGSAALYLLVEPADPAAPTLARTRNWHFNCLAPQFGNDPISVPAIAPHLREAEKIVRAVDDRPGEPLADFWRRARSRLVAWARALPEPFELVRIFGE